MPNRPVQVIQRLSQRRPAIAATLNPLDVTGVAIQDPAILAEAIAILIRDPGIGLIVASTSLPNTPEELANQRAIYRDMTYATFIRFFERTLQPEPGGAR